MKILLALGLLLLPCTSFADDCQIVEFPDHYEAVCTGEPRFVSIPKKDLEAAGSRGSSQSQDPPQTRSSEQSATSPAEAPRASPGVAAGQASGSAGPYQKRQGRQGRPNSEALKAAIEARRQLIREKGTNQQ